jgi:hyperosmotically inducible periplasmic protein
MKATYALALVVATAALLSSSVVLRASETDDRIESSFHTSYVYKTSLKDEHITIRSKDGAVTLAGSVADESHKPLAADTAEALPGVKSVDNQIQITGDQPIANSDGWVSMKVKTALLFHSNVNAHKTNVYVKDGIVTLRGEASSQAQKDLTGERVRDVAGVKGIKNELEVAQSSTQPDAKTQTEAIDDASITAQVKSSLLAHRSTSTLKTKVETDNGVVTLSGPAKNAAEKGLVTKLTEDIVGVKSVVNNMTVSQNN